MRIKPELFEAYAENCWSFAAAATDKDVRRLFTEMATDWTRLASLHRALQADFTEE
jgi:hypothetical protein